MFVHSMLLILLCSSNIASEITKNETDNPETPNIILYSYNEINSTDESNLESTFYSNYNNENITEDPGCNSNNISCYWRKRNLIIQDKMINFDELEKLVNYAVKISIDDCNVPLENAWFIVTKIVNECNNTRGNSHGEKAVKMRNCVFGKLLQQRNRESDWEDFEDIPYLDIKEEECVNELNLDGPTIEDINRYFIVPENNTEFNQFLACFWKKDDVMDDKGNFNITIYRLKLHKVIESEILARSRVIYLSDIITESIIDGCREIVGSNDEELVSNIQDYLLMRIPYFKFVL